MLFDRVLVLNRNCTVTQIGRAMDPSGPTLEHTSKQNFLAELNLCVPEGHVHLNRCQQVKNIVGSYVVSNSSVCIAHAEEYYVQKGIQENRLRIFNGLSSYFGPILLRVTTTGFSLCRLVQGYIRRTGHDNCG